MSIFSQPRNQLDFLLSLTKDEANFHLNTHDGILYDEILVGTAIFKPSPTDPNKRTLLLIKRSSDESLDSDFFKFPISKVNDADASIFAALARKVFEATGLRVSSQEQIIKQMKDMKHESGHIARDAYGRPVTVSKGSFQYNFEVRIDDMRNNPREYSECRWVTEVECQEIDMTRGTERTIQKIWNEVKEPNRKRLFYS